MQKLKFHREALAEFEHAIRYCESERVGLGLAFLQDFEKTRDLILEFPAIGRAPDHWLDRLKEAP